MDYSIIFRDFLIGGSIVGVYSYITHIFDRNNNDVIKISAFIWGIPLIYFYLLFIVWNQNVQNAKDFTNHAIMGTLITLFSMLLTTYIYKIGKYPAILVNFIIVVISVHTYLKYKLYKML
jgi:hypothetical protein